MGKFRDFFKGIAQNASWDLLKWLARIFFTIAFSGGFTIRLDFLRLVPMIGLIPAFIGYGFMAIGVIWLTTIFFHSLSRRLDNSRRLPQINHVHRGTVETPSGIINKFSLHLDELTKGKNISGLGRIFLKNVKVAPPFLGVQYINPVILPIHEQALNEYFLAKLFKKNNQEIIKGGGFYQIKSDDTWEGISIKIYGKENYVDQLKKINGLNSLPSGAYIKVPYKDVSESLGVTSEYIERKYSIAEDKWIEPTIKSLILNLNLLEDEALPLLEMIYEATQTAT